MSPSLSSASCPAQLVVGSMCPRVHLSLSAPASSRFPSYPVSFPFGKLVGSSGLEPPTSRLSGVRSNHLSYEPMSRLLIGFPSLLAAFCACPCPTFGPTRVLLSPLRYAFTREESAFGTGGDEEARTPDPLRARQMLSHLSYTPVHKKALLRPCFPFLTVSFC